MNEGQIPCGWVRANVGDLAEYVNGVAFKPTDWSVSGTPIIRIQNLTDPTKPPNRTTRQADPRLLVRDGDLLFSWSATLDAFIWRGEVAWLNQHIFKVEPESSVEARFLYYLLRYAVKEITRSEHMHGSTMQHINRGPFLSFPVLLPPQAEQGRIAEVLDELLSDLDAGVAALERVRARLKHYRAAVLKAAVEGALTAQWRREHPATETADALLTRILAGRRRRWEEAQLKKFEAAGKAPPKNWKTKYVGPVQPDVTNLTALPDGWQWVSIGQVAEVGTGATPDRGRRERYYSNGNIPWVTSGCVNTSHVREPTEYVTADALRECNVTLYPAGTLLLAMYGEGKTRGMCAELGIESCTNQALAAIVAPAAVRGYLKLFLLKNYEDTRRAATGGVQPNLNLGMVRNIRVPLPPPEEQAEIVEAVEDQLSVIDHLERDLEARLQSAQALRQSILRHAFTGQLVPQDPNDEPASELLKRIAAEREERAQLLRAAKPSRPKTRTPRARGQKS